MSIINLEKASSKQILNVMKPIFILFIIFLCVVAISVTGIYFSIEENDWSLYSRSGAATIVFALILASSNHSQWADSFKTILEVGVEQHKKEEFKEILKDSIQRSLDKHGVTKNDNELAYMLDKEIGLLTEQSKEVLSNFARSIFIKIELLISAYGTLVWGFGDLIGKYV